MKIQGNNAVYEGEISPTLSKNLSILNVAYPEAKHIVFLVDKMFQSAYNRKITPLPIENGKVDFSRGYFFHTIPLNATKESIENRAIYGLLPSERFGALESAGEMRFCVGVTYCNDLAKGCLPRKRYVGKPEYDYWDCMLSQTGRLSFIIDPSIVESSLEFLSYINGTEPKTKQEGEILEFIRKMSPKADEIVTGQYKASFTDFNWRAIVGGIPPQYVVGVFINTDYEDDQTAKQTQNARQEESQKILSLAQICAKAFNCPIINQKGQILETNTLIQNDPTNDIERSK